jgi:hypothetical protein
MAVKDGALKTSCQCNVCIAGIRDEKILLKSARTHLELYGRHPYNRGSTQVRSSLPGPLTALRCSGCIFCFVLG